MSLNFPKFTLTDLAKTIQVYTTVDKTHRGLGRLAVFDTLSDIANRCVLVCGSSGTGKSAISDQVVDRAKRSKLKIDSVTVQGLRKISKILNYNEVSVCVDDLSKGQTEYTQFATVSAFSSLCYTGRIFKLSGQLELNIEGFRGCALINLQPLMLRKIVRLSEYETDIRDKCIRYYHLRFPIKENLNAPVFDKGLGWGYLQHFDLPFNHEESDYLDRAYDNFRYEFTKARAREHMNAYLNASAKFNDRIKVTRADMWLIWQLSRNFRIEPEIMNKYSLEGSRDIDPNLLPLITALATYKNPTIQELVYRYGVKATRMYEIVGELKDYCSIVRQKGIVVPTEATIKILEDIGEW